MNGPLSPAEDLETAIIAAAQAQALYGLRVDASGGRGMQGAQGPVNIIQMKRMNTGRLTMSSFRIFGVAIVTAPAEGAKFWRIIPSTSRLAKVRRQ
jgi:hypothetical protein